MTEQETTYEPWAEAIRAAYGRRESATFILHENIHDRVPQGNEYVSCRTYLETMLKRRDYVVISYDVSRGMRFLDERDAEEFVNLANRGRPPDGKLIRSVFDFPKESTKALAYIEAIILGVEASKRPIAVLIDYADQLAPNAQAATMSETDRMNVVTLQRFARIFYERLQDTSARDAALFLLTPNLHDLHPRIVSSELTTALSIPRPDYQQRLRYVKWLERNLAVSGATPVTLETSVSRFSEQTAGLTLTGIQHIFLRAADSESRTLSSSFVMARKRELLERDSRGMLEVVEPKHGMDAVGGHTAIKAILEQTALDLRNGEDDVPVGIVCPGPNGVGKTFIAKAFAKDSGLNCVQLKNFRGMYVGQTEGNLDLIFSILRSMTPNVVIVDEADKMLGNETSDGSNRVDDRVFGAFTAFMGDPEYRGKIFWLLLTARPFALAPDTGRPGRVEEHVPILAPESISDRKGVLIAVARARGVVLVDDFGNAPSDDDFAAFFTALEIVTPAAMELITNRARRATRRLTNETKSPSGESSLVRVSLSRLKEEAQSYVPDGSSAKLRLQTIEAVMYTNHLNYLPSPWKERLRDEPDSLALERSALRAQVGYS